MDTEWVRVDPGGLEVGRVTNLAPLPAAFVASRAALHRLACYVVSPARKAAPGRIGLVPTPGGFGTPPFAAGRVVRVEGDLMVVESPEGVDALADHDARRRGRSGRYHARRRSRRREGRATVG